MEVSEHAKKRIRKRMTNTKSGTESIAKKALERGIKHSDATGRLKKYFDALYFKNKKANNVRIYAQKVFIFHDENLITMFNLPKQFFNVVKKHDKHEKN